MIGTVIFVTAYEHHQLNDLTNLELVIFAVIEMTLGTALILFIKEFSISYYNTTENITETERKAKIITGIICIIQAKTILSLGRTITSPSLNPKSTISISGIPFTRLSGSR